MKEIIGVLLVNLGTPDSPKTSDVRTYLNEFLTDGRVIDIPWLPRQVLVRGIISPFRAGNSAKSYKAIWSPKGSPLKYISEQQTEQLQEALNAHNTETVQFEVELAMRYQNPDIATALDKLRRKNASRYIIIPMFPQYASASTGSANERVMEVLSSWQTIPAVSFINSYETHPLFIEALTARGREYDPSKYDHILFSFHGLPERQLRKANDHNYCLSRPDCCAKLCTENRFCYSAQCHATAQALAGKLQIPAEKYTVTYQSRLGRDPWVQPYTIKVLEELAAKGIKRILVFCPAFTADCLETIFEISTEYQEEFVAWGGEKLQLVESLNTHPLWIETLKQMVLEQVPTRFLASA